MSKAMSKQEEARQILDDLDSLSPMAGGAPTASPVQAGQDPAAVLAFLDEITQKSSEPTRITTVDKPLSRSGTPTLRKSGERVRIGSTTPVLKPSSSSASLTVPSATAAPDSPANSGTQASQQASQPQTPNTGWGWGSVWSSATAAIQQAKTVVDEQVRNLPANEQARKVIEYAKAAQLDKLGQDFKRVGLSTLTDILNVVAPPISRHEVIKVWLSHDMTGYDGTESLVYRALARIMEQVEGGDLIVNSGDASMPKAASNAERDLHAVDSYPTALKLAQASLDELIEANAKQSLEKPSPSQGPTTHSHVYLRVQPFFTTLDRCSVNETSEAQQAHEYLQFLLRLSDPEHGLVHTTVTQAVPAQWIEFWDEFDWVEDNIAEALRIGVEVIGQEYVVARMGWGGKHKGPRSSRSDTMSSESDEVVVVDEKGEP